MKSLLMSLPMFFVLSFGPSQEAAAPSPASDPRIEVGMERFAEAVRQKQITVASFKGAIENAIDAFFESPKEEQQKRKSHILAMIDFYFQFSDAPFGVLPDFKEAGLAFLPSVLQAYYGMPEHRFEVLVKSSKKPSGNARLLEDWEVDAHVVEIPKMKSIFAAAVRKKIKVSSGYSHCRLHPILKVKRPHNGTDYIDTSKVFAQTNLTGAFVPAGGYLNKNKYTVSEGNSATFIDSTGVLCLKFCHLRDKGWKFLKSGPVEACDFIGFIGRTGLASGPHLHLEAAVAGVQVNPELLCDWRTGEAVFTYWHVDNLRKQALPVRMVKVVKEKEADFDPNLNIFHQYNTG